MILQQNSVFSPSQTKGGASAPEWPIWAWDEEKKNRLIKTHNIFYILSILIILENILVLFRSPQNGSFTLGARSKGWAQLPNNSFPIYCYLIWKQ